MTAAALTPSVEYIEDGVTLLFPVPFRFLAATHLEVKRITAAGVVSTLAHGSAWSATGGTSDAGGTVTLVASVAGSQLKIRRVTPRSQQTDYQTNDTFPAETHEAALDKLTLTDQEQDVKVADTAIRSLQVPEGETAPVLPTAAERANKYPVFNADGDIILSSGTGVDAGLRGDLALKAARDLVGGQIYPASTRAILAGLNTNAFEQAFLTEGERHGFFEWKAGNFAAFVNIDPAQGVYVPPTSDPTGASGVWRRRTDGNDVRPEWFGAIGNYRPSTNTGFDDTLGFQAAFDFSSLTGLASVAGGGPIPRVLLSAKNYLTGNISLRWLSQVEGTSRTASTAVFAKDGTAGVFWGVDDDESPQKVMMRNIALYGRNINTITKMLKLNSAAPAIGSGQHGTEGGLYDLWIRDAPEAIGLEINGNVSYMDRLTIESVKRGLRCLGVGNMAGMITIMQAGQDALDPSTGYALFAAGLTIDDLHVEAPANGMVPIQIYRSDVHIRSLKVSVAAATSWPALIQTDDLQRPEFGSRRPFSIDAIMISNPANAVITEDGCVRHGNPDAPVWLYKMGKDLSVLNNGERLNYNRMIEDRRVAVYQSFVVRIFNDAGVIKYAFADAANARTRTISNVSVAGLQLTNSLAPGGAAFDADTGNGQTLVFNVADQINEPFAHISSVSIVRNGSAQASLRAEPGKYSVTTSDGGAKVHILLNFWKGAGAGTKAPLDLALLPNTGDEIRVAVAGWWR